MRRRSALTQHGKPRGSVLWGLALGAYAATSAYFRYRPLPPGINGWAASYRVPSDCIAFYHNSTWYEGDTMRTHRQISDRVREIIAAAREVVLLDIFLFNLHHTNRKDFLPTTRQIARDLGAKSHPRYFITDPLNTFYGTARCEPLEWLKDAGVTVCETDLHQLRDNNLIYSPLWRAFLQWAGTGRDGHLQHPLEEGKTITIRSLLEAPNARGNHRKVIVADDGNGDYVSMVTSANFEDASCYFLNTALEIRSKAVAHHFFEAERAVARFSGCDIPAHVPPAEAEGGDAEVTPLMGDQIKTAALEDIRAAGPGDQLYLFMLFLADRDVMQALIDADRRGASVTVILDQNKVSFGEEKNGFPNQLVAPELVRRSDIEVRWANTRKEEFHSKFMLLRRPEETVIHAGSANYTRRSLSNTNPEANMRVAVPNEAGVAQQTWDYVQWMTEEPRSLPYEAGDPMAGRLKYWVSRLQEATGLATW